MISKKPVPVADISSTRMSSPRPVLPVADRSEFSIPSSSSNRKPSHVIAEGDADVNPWQDTTLPSDISEGWQDAGVAVASSSTKHITSQLGASDLPDRTEPDLRKLTPQSSWEKESEASFEEPSPNPFDSTAPSREAPSPPQPQPPSQSSPPPHQIETNPFRAKSSERAPHVPISKEEDSSNIWAEIIQDKESTDAHPVLITEFGTLGLEDKAGWDSVRRTSQASLLKSDSPLINFDHAEEYKKELESTPFGPPEGLEDLGHNQPAGKGKVKAIHIIPDNDEDVFPAPISGSPAKIVEKSTDRKITVSEAVVNKQRSEIYQIKHIRWADSSSQEIRTSPILIQNRNGPCPLMALVNALTLSTPSNLNTAFIETLRVREQITLGLLLDAVFDELMSGRRGNAAQGLPDVSELYAFLMTLHTGMNVNPRFIPTKRQEQSLMDGTFHEVPWTEEDYRKPGSFEDTKEMMLYSTFSVPLIHGWLPPRSHLAFEAVERSAISYEDAQNLMFREEELEDKAHSTGLSPTEQQLLEDISSIKYFLSSTATQLTEHGLEILNENLEPGAIAILFRNDHFSTLYKQPRTGQILLLVTDAGYSTHDEIVWESLIDVSGERSEFLSGDFRPVGGELIQPQAFDQSGPEGTGWTTVQRNRGRGPANNFAEAADKTSLHQSERRSSSARGRNHEQEDADLALAMQLQEEEEENSRRTAAQRRQQEEEASSHYLSQNDRRTQTSTATGQRRSISQQQASQNIRPLLPPRRTNNSTNPRPAVHREQSTTNENEPPPPSYDDASSAERYSSNLSQNLPAYNASQAANSPRSGQQSSARIPSGRPRGESTYSINNNQGQPPVGVTRRRTSGANEGNKDCILM